MLIVAVCGRKSEMINILKEEGGGTHFFSFSYLIQLKVHPFNSEKFCSGQKWSERSSTDSNLTLINKSEKVAHIYWAHLWHTNHRVWCSRNTLQKININACWDAGTLYPQIIIIIINIIIIIKMSKNQFASERKTIEREEKMLYL